ncbi:MAG: hypothetical protein PHW94_09090, partial [Sulfurimonas sp.]|nr:hypothetical protein [Sulfurimonas sp.]
GHKESPSAAEVMLRLDELEKAWGKEHLRLGEQDVEVLSDTNQSVVKISIETQKERLFLKHFFGI